MPDDFKGTVFRKNLWEFIYMSMEEKTYYHFILIKKYDLCVRTWRMC